MLRRPPSTLPSGNPRNMRLTRVERSRAGAYSAVSAFMVIDGYRYPTIRTGEGPLLKADLDRIKKRTAIWQAKAKAYGDVK